MDDRIDSEWRREEPHGSVYQTAHKTKGGTEKRWYAQFRARDHAGKLKTYRDTRSRTKKAAQVALLELKKRALANKQPPARLDLGPNTVAEYLDQWHDQRVEEGLIRPNTAVNEKRHVELWKALIGAHELRLLAPDDVEAALTHLQTVKLKGKRRAIQQAFRCLRKALADVRPRLASNPCDAVDKPTVAKPETRAFTADELRSIIAAADKPRKGCTAVDETFAALVFFLANTGVRIGEALALNWGDVDFEDQTVHIRKTLIVVKGVGARRMEPKTKSAIRSIPLNASTFVRLKAIRGMLGAIPHGTAPVFASERGGPLHVSNASRRGWHPILVELGLEQCGFHRLRHTFASHVLQAGLDIGTVSKMLGHADASITLSVYGHFLPGREREAADAIAAVIDGSHSG